MLDNFSGWILQRESDDNWITVAESTEYKEECPLDSSNYMISVISKNINYEKLFNNSEWRMVKLYLYHVMKKMNYNFLYNQVYV